MARLNEVPASAETVESLKRRFVRQNREIARANSIQSLRIRHLEAEVSRLLAENVALRKEVISLGQDLEKYEGSERIDTGIASIKEKLEAKLSEISSIVTDLGKLPQRHTAVASALRLPKNTEELEDLPTDVEGESNPRIARGTPLAGVLPVIQEDKLYPRLSLESDGNPPEEEDNIGDYEEDNERLDTNTWDGLAPTSPEPQESPSPIRQNSIPLPSQLDDDDEYAHAPDSPPSLEMRKRRKRRDSALLKDIIPKADGAEASDACMASSPEAPKAGRKRKFSVSHDEEPASPQQNYQSDDFQFTRVTGQFKPPANDESQGAENLVFHPIPKDPEILPAKKSTAKGARRALEPKSTNVGPKSPAKRRPKGGEWSGPGEKATQRREAGKEGGRTPRQPLTAVFNQPDRERPSVVDLRRAERSSQSAEAGPVRTSGPSKSADPKPRKVAEMPSVDDSTNEEAPLERSRHPRRSRGAVSYAEPNLRDKMRRPTEELVNAVVGDAMRRFSRAHREEATIADSGEGEALQRRSSNRVESTPETRAPNRHPSDTVSRKQTESVDRGSGVISALVGASKKRPQDRKQPSTKADFEGHQSFSDNGEDGTDLRTSVGAYESFEGSLSQPRRYSSSLSSAGGSRPIDSRRPERKPAEMAPAPMSDDSTFSTDVLTTSQVYHGTAQDRRRRLINDVAPIIPAEEPCPPRLSTRRRTTMV